MAPEIVVRFLWSAGIILAMVGLYRLLNHYLLARLRGKRLGLDSLRPGVPAILYFTTPTCIPCKTVQRPAIQALQQHLGVDGLQVIEIDASQRPDLADYWGVLSVPTTFIIDSQGRPRRVNHGVTRADKLLQQIQLIEGRKGEESPTTEVLAGRVK